MFQTRNEDGEIKLFNTLKEAFDEAKVDPTVWKISTDGVRLIRRIIMGGICWNNEPIEQKVNEELEKKGISFRL
jgi:hypothetical protein